MYVCKNIYLYKAHICCVEYRIQCLKVQKHAKLNYNELNVNLINNGGQEDITTFHKNIILSTYSFHLPVYRHTFFQISTYVY